MRYYFSLQFKQFCSVSFLLLSTSLCFHSNAVLAKDLGVEGAVYSIAEPDLLNGIHQKLEVMQKSGELMRQNEAIRRRALQHILRPVPVSGVSDLAAGQVPESRSFDPSIIVDKAIRNERGQLIVAKGTRINPLDARPFQETLVFINGDNANQIKWARDFSQHPSTVQQDHKAGVTRALPKTVKIILVNGDVNDSARLLKHRVYFDQNGTLCHRFKVVHTPTIVYQPQHHGVWEPTLRVEEVSVD